MENSILTTLPTEIQLEVLDRLSVKDLLNCSLVCREIAILANELVVKKANFKIRFRTDPSILVNAVRKYRNLWLTDQHFIYEAEKLNTLLRLFMQNQGIKLREIRLEMLEELDGPERITEFFEFLIRNPEVQTVTLSSFYELTLNEFIVKIKSILPHVNVHILRAFEEDKNVGFIVPEKLQSLEIYSEMTEIQLLRTLKCYPNLKTLRYCLKSHKNPKEVTQEMLRLNIKAVSVENLLLNDIENLEETSPSLSVFKSLKSMTVHFRDEGIFQADLVQEYSDKFKFIQGLYANNFRTLRNLQLEISGSQHIYNLLPSKDINLTLEEMSFDLSFSDNTEEDALKFVKLFVNQQVSNLKKLYIENMEIDDEMINLLSEAEHLEKLSLITCDIQYETVWPAFSNLKVLDLTDSTITYSSLQSFLGNYRIQNTLECLTLERIHPKKGRKKQLKVTCPYNFLKLKQLNLQFCNMKIDFLGKFHAPELEQLNYDYHDLELPLSYVLEFPQLKVLCLGMHSDFEEISKILTQRHCLEIFEIMVSSGLLTTIIKYLLIYGGNIKLAKIVCTDLAEVIDSLEKSFKESVHNYPGYNFEFHKEREKFIKFSNTSTTIIVHTYNQAYREHSQFYENLLITLWE